MKDSHNKSMVNKSMNNSMTSNIGTSGLVIPLFSTLDTFLVGNQQSLLIHANVLNELAIQLKDLITAKDKKGSNTGNTQRSLETMNTDVYTKEKNFNEQMRDQIKLLDKKMGESYFDTSDEERYSYVKQQREEKGIQHQCYTFLKELAHEVEDVTKGIAQNCNKLEDKFLRNSKIMDIINDPHAIFIVLEENLNKNHKSFLDNLKKEVDTFMVECVESSDTSPESCQQTFNQKVALYSIEKMNEEALNIKNAFNLLDLNLTLNVLNKGEELDYEFVKKRARENNERISNIIENSAKIMNYSEIIHLDSKTQTTDPKTLYNRVLENYQSMGASSQRSSIIDKKNNLRVQIYELIKENGGFRIGMNHLLYILYKYSIIISDMASRFHLDQ
jgi:hypothetical protein